MKHAFHRIGSIIRNHAKNAILLTLGIWIAFGPVTVPVVTLVTQQNTQTNHHTTMNVSLLSTVKTAHAQSLTDSQTTTEAALDCNVVDIFCGLVKFVVFTITIIPNLVAAIIGVTADVVFNYSIGHGFYKATQEMVFTAWKIVRDISNLVIIFALFLAAFSLILGGDDDGVLSKLGSPKKIIVRTIVIALFINFSFFFGRVMIDAGNLGARFIYNQIDSTGVTFGSAIGMTPTSGTDPTETENIKPISLILLAEFQPQQLLGKATDLSESGFSITLAYLTVGFMVFFIDLVLIYIFFIMLFLFVGRMAVLLLLVVISPLAFASLPIPFLADNKYFGFENWLKQISGQAFLGIAFMFFIYLAIMFLQIPLGLPNPSAAGEGISQFILLIVGICIKLALVFATLFYGKKIATDMAGTVGELINKAAGVVAGLAVGAATGGTAMLAKQSLGRLGSGIANSTTLMGAQARGGALGLGAGLLRSGAGRVGASSFDFRNSPKFMSRFNQATGALGGGEIPMGTTFQNKGGFAAEGTVGEQYRGLQKDISAKITERRTKAADDLQLNLQAKSARDERAIQDKLDIANQAVTNKKTEIENLAQNEGIQEKARAKYEKPVKAIDTYERTEADLNSRMDAAKTAGTYDLASIKRGFDAEEAALAALKPEYDKAKKDEEKNRNGLAAINEVSGKDLRQVTNEVEKLKVRAETSTEKRDFTKAEEDATKSKTEANQKQTELKQQRANMASLLKNAGADSDVYKNAEKVEKDLTEQLINKQKTDNEKQEKLKAAKKLYNAEYGDKIKVLEDSVKDSIKAVQEIYQGEVNELQRVATKLSTEVIDKKFETNLTNTVLKQTYAEDLNARTFTNPIAKKMAETVGTITGGIVFGGNVRNTNATAANNIRNNIKGK